MQYKDLKNSNHKDLLKMDQELRAELFQLKLKLKTQQLTNKNRLREVRHDIARVQTKISELTHSEKNL